jgi:hypothetical protein
MKGLLLSMLMLLCWMGTAQAQLSDFMVLKKRNGKTIKTFFQGSPILFTTTNGGSHQGVIDKINNDSLFVSEYVVVQMPTRLGVYVLDTAARYRYKFHYNEIRSIHHEKKGFNFARSGISLMGGSVLLLLGNGVSYLVSGRGMRPAILAGIAGLGIVGYFITRLQTSNFVLGNKYHLRYMSVQPTR